MSRCDPGGAQTPTPDAPGISAHDLYTVLIDNALCEVSRRPGLSRLLLDGFTLEPMDPGQFSELARAPGINVREQGRLWPTGLSWTWLSQNNRLLASSVSTKGTTVYTQVVRRAYARTY